MLFRSDRPRENEVRLPVDLVYRVDEPDRARLRVPVADDMRNRRRIELSHRVEAIVQRRLQTVQLSGDRQQPRESSERAREHPAIGSGEGFCEKPVGANPADDGFGVRLELQPERRFVQPRDNGVLVHSGSYMFYGGFQRQEHPTSTKRPRKG